MHWDRDEWDLFYDDLIYEKEEDDNEEDDPTAPYFDVPLPYLFPKMIFRIDEI